MSSPVEEVKIDENSISLVDPDALEKIERYEELTEKPKKCFLKDDVHLCFKCCTYSWAFSLNCCEFGCGLLSDCFLGISKTFLCCKNCLEKIDCDGH